MICRVAVPRIEDGAQCPAAASALSSATSAAVAARDIAGVAVRSAVCTGGPLAARRLCSIPRPFYYGRKIQTEALTRVQGLFGKPDCIGRRTHCYEEEQMYRRVVHDVVLLAC
jgi:hypothetical protein